MRVIKQEQRAERRKIPAREGQGEALSPEESTDIGSDIHNFAEDEIKWWDSLLKQAKWLVREDSDIDNLSSLRYAAISVAQHANGAEWIEVEDDLWAAISVLQDASDFMDKYSKEMKSRTRDYGKLAKTLTKVALRIDKHNKS